MPSTLACLGGSMLCPNCSSLIPEGKRFCGDCGSNVDSTSAATWTSPEDSCTPTSAPSLDESRFLPGARVADRYRIIGLLGRGGMGEVYRADDLKLGQPVALKFLPVELSGDQSRLNRFLHEVKIARQVAHPNVCRVYDVGEAEGHHYLSMEYVDGEDLSTLLRRIGRLPEDKAVEIARQICAGLAAAHELGILHRDIKPANVMLDGRGRAKLTDFGLAGLAEEFHGAELRAGTPTYMAPEQIEGKEVSVRSDVYSLGLVLYELFTGKRAFDAGSAVEVARQQIEATPTSPSSFMTSFDPAVERVILQCLEKEPQLRPPTALAVAAALPGGDPLAAALAAGETPSPEMVAAAGPQGGLKPGVATTCLVSVMLIWVLGTFLVKPIWPYTYLPMRKSYEALKENAREIAERLGYDEVPADTWAGFGITIEEYFHLVREHGAAGVADHISQPGQAMYWMDYRQDNGPLVPLSLNGRVNWNSPPASAGEVAMEVDLQGRLNALRVTPSRREDSADSTETEATAGEVAATESTAVDWAEVFELAGLDITQFEPATPMVRPYGFADQRWAWTGTIPDYHDRAARVEAASLEGKPVYFQKLISSDALWPDEAGRSVSRVGTGFLFAALLLLVVAGLVVLCGALFLAVRNLKLGRGDRKGAFRVAAFVFLMRFLHWALSGDHVGHPVELIPLVITICGATTMALSTWIVYVACEPYVRRLWPETMVSWTRVLSGRLRDPLVGRDVLIGCTIAALVALIQLTGLWIAAKMEVIGIVPMQQHLVLMRGGRYAVGQVFSSFLNSVAIGLGIMMLFLILRLICRKTVIAAAVLVLIGGAFGALNFIGIWGATAGMLGFAVQALGVGFGTWVLVRFGLLALVAFMVYATLGNITPLTFEASAPYFGIGLFYTAIALALVAYGWHASLAGRSLMQDSLLEG